MPIFVDIASIIINAPYYRSPQSPPSLLPTKKTEEKRTMNTNRVILQLVLLAALIASAIGSRGETSPAWHAPPKKAFGVRKNSSKRNSPKPLSTVTVDTIQHALPSANLVDTICHQDNENTEEASPRNQRILPASARAAAVAFVSAAAIGTTRHALERILPC